MSGRVTERDNGYAALIQRIADFGHPKIAMGILEADGAKEHQVEGSEAPMTIIEIAQLMEFGFTMANGTEVPARSFIRAWWDEASPGMREDLGKLLRGVVEGKRTKREVLELLGLKGAGEIQARIAAGIDPPNKPSTIERKGSSTPLIAGGQLRSSVSHAVIEDD